MANNGRALSRPPVNTPAPTVGVYEYDDEAYDPGGSLHLHWTIQAFRDADVNTGALHDTVVVSVEAATEHTAIARAMKIIVRPYYRVSSVVETCSLDEALRR